MNHTLANGGAAFLPQTLLQRRIRSAYWILLAAIAVVAVVDVVERELPLWIYLGEAVALLVALLAAVFITVAAEWQRRALASEQDERRRAEKQLEDTVVELQDLWNNTPCGYHSVDGDGVFLRINDTELVWLGYTREELIGKLRIADVLTDSLVILAQTFPLLKQRGWVRDLEAEFLCKDGSVFPVLLSSSAVVDVDGNFVRSRTTTLDNTARKQFEREKADFFSMVAHDIRNPVSTMLGGLEILDELEEVGDEAREVVALVGRSAKLLSSLVNDYLDYAKIEAGAIQLMRKPLPLTPVFRVVCGDIRYEAERKGVQIDVELALDVGEIDADAMAVHRIFSNLVGNAVKFTPGGGRVCVRAERRGASVAVSISDTGPGIAAAEIPLLFARYQQAAAGHRAVGTGLGLFVVKSLVEAHGGTVEIESALGQGTTFIVFLPAAAAHSQAA